MEDFKRRLLLFFQEYLGLSQSAFEDECGLSHGTISSIKVKGPSVDVIMKISSTYQELDLNWLISGRGEMLIGNTAPEPEEKKADGLDYTLLKNVIVEAIKEATR